MSGLARRSIYSKWLTRGQHAAVRPAHHYRGNLPDLATSLLPGVIIPHFTHQQEKSVSTFRAVVSAFWAFLSSRQSSSVLYWFYSTVSVLINKIFIHSFIHSFIHLPGSEFANFRLSVQLSTNVVVLPRETAGASLGAISLAVLHTIRAPGSDGRNLTDSYYAKKVN